jgi:hypothetical protein
MSAPQETYQMSSHRILRVGLLVLNLIVMLFPPIHLTMASGDMKNALIYFVGSPLILIVSLGILYALDKNTEGAHL